jgi:hypothetical protein
MAPAPRTSRSSGSIRGGKGGGGVKFPPHQDHKPAPAPAAGSKVTSTSQSNLIMGKAKSGGTG